MSYDSGCAGCLRNSPVPSLLAMIYVLIAAGGFTFCFIFSFQHGNQPTKFIKLNNTTIFDSQIASYSIYGLLGATALYVILCFILGSFSTSYNRKRFFEGTTKTKVGRCCTIFNIICLVFGIMIWLLIFCYTSLLFMVYSIDKMSDNVPTNIVSSLESSDSTSPSSLLVLSTTNASFAPDISTEARFSPKLSALSRIEDNETNLIINLKDYKYYPYIGSMVICCFVIILGLIQLLCCSVMNFVRLGEERYYENMSYMHHKNDQMRDDYPPIQGLELF